MKFFLSAALLTLAQTGWAVLIENEIPGAEIKPTASSTYSPRQDAVNVINGSGLAGDRHDAEGGSQTMWHTVENPGATAIAGIQSPAWIRFDFAKPESFDKILIWNHNQGNGLIDRGFRKTRIFGTVDGTTWLPLAAIELARGGETAQTVAVAAKEPLKAVVIAAESNWGGNVYGLSEVKFISAKDLAEADLPFPTELAGTPQPCYRHRSDGKSGRELAVVLKGAKLYGKATVTVKCEGKTETTPVPANSKGISSFTILLPEGVAVAKDSQAAITLASGARKVAATIAVPAKRQWTIYLFPHSHVDIGYTNPQDVVEKIHMRNMDVGLVLGKATAHYPEGARHIWNNEVLWAVDNWLNKATPEQKQLFVESVKNGQIGLSASYVNANTSVASDEELMHDFACAKRLRELTGTPIDTMCQFDIPGISWGMVQAAAQNGVRTILDFPNPSDRTGTVHVWRNKHFRWVAPDGKTKVLYLQVFPYNVAWKLGAFNMNPKPYTDAPGRDSAHFACTPLNGSGEFTFPNFVFNETAALEKAGSPYDIYPCAWSLSDNAPVDVDLPDYVKKWNESYAYPRLVIASASTIANAFETRFGKVIPEVRGDLTEYWTDGLGTDARRVGYNRPAKEMLVQAEILSTMLGGKPLPAADSYAAWRWIQLGTEHTWGYMMPDQPIAKTIEATKASYFEKARDTSRAVLGKTVDPIVKPWSDTITVFNTLAWPRTDPILIPAADCKGFASVEDTTSQRLSTGELVFLASEIPALGSRTYKLSKNVVESRHKSMVVGNTLENDLVKATLDPQTGDIASLVDKKTGHEFVNAESPYRLNSYRYLRGGDAPAKATGPTEVKITIKENGPVVASLLVESKAEGCNKLTREIRIIAGKPQIEIVNTVDKIATRAKEGIHFAFAFNLPKDATARMDIPWGVMNPVTDQIDGANKNWLACQRWIDVSGADCGVTWVPVEASIVQFGDITANLLGAVARSSWKKEIGDTRTIVSWALNNHWHTNFPLEQGGIIPFNYAILPHGAYDPVVANRFGLEQNQPLIAVPTEKREETKAAVALDNPRIFISTLKPSDDGQATILRLRSLSDKPETVKLSFPAGKPKSIELSDAMESAGKKAGSKVSLLPYGTATLILRMK